MTTTARHMIGAIYGVVLLPLVPLTLGTGLGWMAKVIATYEFTSVSIFTGLALVVLGSVLLGLTSAPWMSPLSGLVAGVVFSIYGAALIVLFSTGMGPLGTLLTWDPMWQSYGPTMYLLMGPLLITTAVWPSRWRSGAGSGPNTGRPGPYPPNGPHPGAPGGYQGAPGGYPQPAPGYPGGPMGGGRGEGPPVDGPGGPGGPGPGGPYGPSGGVPA